MLLKRREGNPQDRGSPESTDLGTVARRVARRRAAPREAKGCDFLTILGHFRLEFVLGSKISKHNQLPTDFCDSFCESMVDGSMVQSNSNKS